MKLCKGILLLFIMMILASVCSGCLLFDPTFGQKQENVVEESAVKLPNHIQPDTPSTEDLGFYSNLRNGNEYSYVNGSYYYKDMDMDVGWTCVFMTDDLNDTPARIAETIDDYYLSDHYLYYTRKYDRYESYDPPKLRLSQGLFRANLDGENAEQISDIGAYELLDCGEIIYFYGTDEELHKGQVKEGAIDWCTLSFDGLHCFYNMQFSDPYLYFSAGADENSIDGIYRFQLGQEESTLEKIVSGRATRFYVMGDRIYYSNLGMALAYIDIGSEESHFIKPPGSVVATTLVACGDYLLYSSFPKQNVCAYNCKTGVEETLTEDYEIWIIYVIGDMLYCYTDPIHPFYVEIHPFIDAATS